MLSVIGQLLAAFTGAAAVTNLSADLSGDLSREVLA